MSVVGELLFDFFGCPLHSNKWTISTSENICNHLLEGEKSSTGDHLISWSVRILAPVDWRGGGGMFTIDFRCLPCLLSKMSVHVFVPSDWTRIRMDWRPLKVLSIRVIFFKILTFNHYWMFWRAKTNNNIWKTNF